MTERARRRGRIAFALSALAFAWGVGFAVVAGLELGSGAWLFASLPAILVGLAGWDLHDVRSGTSGGGMAWTCIGLLVAAMALGALTVGPFLLPAVVLIASAAALTTSDAARA